MLKRIVSLSLSLSLLVLLCIGCGTQQPQETTAALPTDTTINEHILDDIKKRGKLIVGCKTDVPDLSLYDSETDTWEGLEIDLAYYTAAELFGVSYDEAIEKQLVEFVGVTVADREEQLENGNIDLMLATYSITDERKERFALSNEYYTDYIGMMVKTSGSNPNSLGSSDIKSIADLDGKYIGVPRNATTRNDFINYIELMNTIRISPIFCEYDSYENLARALHDGNIDVMAVDVSILNGYVNNKTMILKDRFGSQNYGAAVTKENALLIDVVNAAIENYYAAEEE